MSDPDRLVAIKAHLQQYWEAAEATAAWMALGDKRPLVSPPGIPVYEWYGQDVALLIAEVEKARKERDDARAQIEQAWQKFDRADAQREDAQAEVDARRAEVERLRDLLGRLEWVDVRHLGPEADGECPVCWSVQPGPHDDCWLAAELAKHQETR